MAEVKLIKKVGQGAFGTVFLGERNGKRCAVKVVALGGVNPRIAQDAIKEGKLLEQLHHPNIVLCEGCYAVKSSNHSDLHIVMEYCSGGDLYDNIKRKRASGLYFPESQIIGWFLDISRAVEYLHSKGVIHRDIKPLNILKHEDGTIKLGDFGLAKILKTKKDIQASVMGTVIYASPELHMKSISDYRGDIWSLGCTLYELAKLEPAFRSPGELINFAQNRSALRPIPNDYTTEVKHLIKTLLRVHPDERPSAVDILKIVQPSKEGKKPTIEPDQSRKDPFAAPQNNPAARFGFHGNNQDKPKNDNGVQPRKRYGSPFQGLNGPGIHMDMHQLGPGFNLLRPHMRFVGVPRQPFQFMNPGAANDIPPHARRDGKSPVVQGRGFLF